jgi:CRP-like cAMP-binding protein
VLETGGFFGEMSMLIDTPRTAGAVAAAPETRVIEISRGNFETILQEYPRVAVTILKELATRLKATDEQAFRPPPSTPPPDPSVPT